MIISRRRSCIDFVDLDGVDAFNVGIVVGVISVVDADDVSDGDNDFIIGLLLFFNL